MANEVRDTTGLKAAVSILEKWGATGEQITATLGVAYDHVRQEDPCWQVSLDADQLTRISLVLNMHAALRVLFDNPENLYGFMAMANHNAYFQGRPLLEVISCGNLNALYETWRYLDAISHTA